MQCCGPCDGVFIARIFQLDTVETAASPGYDNILTEPKLASGGPDDPIGTVGRVETQYDVAGVQVEMKNQYTDRLRQGSTGKNKESVVEIIVSRHVMESMGLIDENGESKIRTGARLDRILNRSGTLVQAYPNPPGLFLASICYDSWTSGSFGLIIMEFRPRERAR